MTSLLGIATSTALQVIRRRLSVKGVVSSLVIVFVSSAIEEHLCSKRPMSSRSFYNPSRRRAFCNSTQLLCQDEAESGHQAIQSATAIEDSRAPESTQMF